MSKEHVWSDWMAKLFPESVPSYIEYKSVHTAKTVQVSHEVHERQGSAISKKLRVVCRDCNMGWMKAIEDAARPILTPLMLGIPSILYENEQCKLAEWVALKMMVAEHNTPDEVVVPQADRDRFFRGRIIPPYFRIWVVSSDSEKWRSRYIRHNATLVLPGAARPTVKRNTQTIAWGIGKVVVYTAMTISEGMDLMDFIYVDPRVLRLFPRSGSTYPIPFLVRLNDAAADKMAGMLDTLIQSPHVIYKS